MSYNIGAMPSGTVRFPRLMIGIRTMNRAFLILQ